MKQVIEQIADNLRRLIIDNEISGRAAIDIKEQVKELEFIAMNIKD